MNYVNTSCTTCKLSCMHCVDTSPKVVYRGIEPGGVNWKVSRFPMVLLPAYSLLKQEQLQLAQLAFVTIQYNTLHYITLNYIHTIPYHTIPLHCIALHYITLHTYRQYNYTHVTYKSNAGRLSRRAPLSFRSSSLTQQIPKSDK